MWIIEEEIDRNPLGGLSGQSKGHVRPAKGRRLSVLDPRCGVVMEMKALRSILNLLYCVFASSTNSHQPYFVSVSQLEVGLGSGRV